MPDDPRIFCNSCDRITRHIVQQIFEYARTDGQIVRWKTVQCGGCDEVSFIGSFFYPDDVDQENTISVIYPIRMTREIKQFDGLDARLDEIYREMITAYNNRLYILCAGGLRALVEGICADQNIDDGPKRNLETDRYEVNRQGVIRRGRTLDCKIEGLAERHILNEQQARSLHEHRYLGNMALHELELPNSDTLSLAIIIVEHIMEALYRLPVQVGNLRRMRANTND